MEENLNNGIKTMLEKEKLASVQSLEINFFTIARLV